MTAVYLGRGEECTRHRAGLQGDGEGRSLKLNNIKPALSGSFKATTVDGKSVEVHTVFDMMRQARQGIHARAGIQDSGIN